MSEEQCEPTLENWKAEALASRQKLSELEVENKDLKRWVNGGVFRVRFLESQVATLQEIIAEAYPWVVSAPNDLSEQKRRILKRMDGTFNPSALDAAGKRVEVNVINKEKK